MAWMICGTVPDASFPLTGGRWRLDGGFLHAEGGVYGAAFDREFRLKHVGVFSEKELDRLRGSKYLQSDTGTTFSQVRDLLRQGKSVYYTGNCRIKKVFKT